jgi:hypothetical protein
MGSSARLMHAATCGTYSWMCCLPLERFYEMKRIETEMGASDFADLYAVACNCAGGKVPGGQVQPPNAGDCVKMMNDFLCSPEGQKWAHNIDEAITMVLALPIKLDDKTKLILGGLQTMIDQLEKVCGTGGFTQAHASAMCSAIAMAKSTMNGLPDIVQSAVDSIMSKIVNAQMAALMKVCCP